VRRRLTGFLLRPGQGAPSTSEPPA